MDLRDLNAAERVALVALVRSSVLSDGTLSENESAELDLLVTELGEDSYQQVARVATARVRDLSSLRQVLQAVTNQEARELIYGTLLQIAIPETVDPGENRLLDLVTEVWGVRPKFVGFPSEEGE